MNNFDTLKNYSIKNDYLMLESFINKIDNIDTDITIKDNILKTIKAGYSKAVYHMAELIKAGYGNRDGYYSIKDLETIDNINNRDKQKTL